MRYYGKKGSKRIILASISILLIFGVVFLVFHLYNRTNKINIEINRICKNRTIPEVGEQAYEEYDSQIANIDFDLYEVEYNGKKYMSNDRYVQDKYVGELLIEKDQTFYKTEGSVKIQVYKIKDMSEDLAIVIKVPEDDRYFLYYNFYYKIETPRQLIEDFGFNDIGEHVWVGLYPTINADSISVEEGILDYIKEKVKLLGSGTLLDKKTNAEEAGLHLVIWFDNVREVCVIEFYDNGDVRIVLPLTISTMGVTIRMGEEGIDLALEILKYCEQNGKGIYMPNTVMGNGNHKK